MLNISNKIQKAADFIIQAQYIIAFTGAGISVESGIPDFRGPGGLWERFNPDEYATYWAFQETPEKFWTMHSSVSELLQISEPNPAHIGLARLEQLGKLKSVITQNIDSLHSKAGNTKVLELHGSGATASCLNCHKNYTYEFVQSLIDEGHTVPRCTCSGLIKPDVVLFGEPLPYKTLQEAEIEIAKSDLLIVIGSSLQIYPAAGLPRLAKEKINPARILIINKEPTNLDKIADLVIHGNAGEIIPKIIKLLETI
ncbi:MAG: SIR2 family NAD-dependent protein deacylase [Candidatus Hodarchaeales archaeon]